MNILLRKSMVTCHYIHRDIFHLTKYKHIYGILLLPTYMINKYNIAKYILHVAPI